MAACQFCGKPAGYSGVCKNCTPKAEQIRAQHEAEKEVLAAANRQREAADQEREWEELVATVEARLRDGEAVYLHAVVPVGVSSAVNGNLISQSDFSAVTNLGLEGWELVGMVPRTDSTTLSNSTGRGNEVWAGGIGGNVVGAHAVLKKTYLALPADLSSLHADLELAYSQ